MPGSSRQAAGHDQRHAPAVPGVSPGPTFDRVYAALKARLTGGWYAPGDHLEPAVIGGDLNASVTPVRDALHRLAGELMVETPEHDGFRVPAPTEAELRDLYRWNETLALLALRRPSPVERVIHAPATPPELAGEPLTAAELFSAIAMGAGSGEHEAAVASLNDRLGGIRVVEGRLFGDAAEELAALRVHLANRDLVRLRRGVADYHRRRRRSVGELIVAARMSRRTHRENNR